MIDLSRGRNLPRLVGSPRERPGGLTIAHARRQSMYNRPMIECPRCHSFEEHRVIWGRRNIRPILGNLVLVVVTLVLVVPVREGWALERRCLKCGYRFLGPRAIVPDFDECAKCGYSLTGNVSGRCPECGWKLPRRYRAYRRKMDRSSAGGSDGQQRFDA